MQKKQNKHGKSKLQKTHTNNKHKPTWTKHEWASRTRTHGKQKETIKQTNKNIKPTHNNTQNETH